jgi:hypothetical protein
MGTMTGEAKSVQTRLWPGGWCLVGNGPSYLLFRNPEKEVTHLSSGMHRELREALKGYCAIQDDKLAPLVRALFLASADAIYDVEGRTNASERKWAAYMVVREITELIREFPQREIFARRLRRLATCLRAAGQYEMYHGAPGVPEGTYPPGSFFAHDLFGQRLLVTSSCVYKCEPDSRIARCAQELWRRDGRTVPYRVPTRKELREYLCSDEPAVTKLCRAQGCNWLPKAQRGRKSLF